MSRPICGPQPCAWVCKGAVTPPGECPNCIGGGPGVIPTRWDGAWGDIGCDCSQIPTTDRAIWDSYNSGGQGVCQWRAFGPFSCVNGATDYELLVSFDYGLSSARVWNAVLTIFDDSGPDPVSIESYTYSNFFNWPGPDPFPCGSELRLDFSFITPSGPATVCNYPPSITLNPGGTPIDPLSAVVGRDGKLKPKLPRGKLPKG